MHNAKEVAAFAAQFKPGHWCFLEPASEKTWWNGNPNQLHGKWDSVASQMVDILMCHTSHPLFPATAPLSLGQLRNGGRHCHFQGTCENKNTLMITIWARTVLCIYICVCQRYHTENLLLAPRRLEEEEGDRPRPGAVDNNSAKKKRAEHVTSSRRVDAETHCEARKADSQGFRTGRICQNGGDWTVLYHQ